MNQLTSEVGVDEVGRVLVAAGFSAERHTDQRRKGKRAEPYINHPLKVAEILRSVGAVEDVEIIIAALLHDTVEDTATTPSELEELFGPRVRSIVVEVTDDKSLPKARRKSDRSSTPLISLPQRNRSSWLIRPRTSRTLRLPLPLTGRLNAEASTYVGQRPSLPGCAAVTICSKRISMSFYRKPGSN